MEQIGLFPLGIVLFPESAYPLHIFEERYKKLINDCLAEKKIFGINYMSEKNMREIGCTAEVDDLIKSYEDGKMDILVTGIKRYRVINFFQDKNLYYTADIEYIEDIHTEVDPFLLDEAVMLFNEIAENIRSIKVDKLEPDMIHTTMPSFYMAQKAGLTSIQKQLLLEMLSESERLHYVNEHMKNILPVIKHKDDLGEILRNDGYYKPNLFKS